MDAQNGETKASFGLATRAGGSPEHVRSFPIEAQGRKSVAPQRATVPSVAGERSSRSASRYPALGA